MKIKSKTTKEERADFDKAILEKVCKIVAILVTGSCVYYFFIRLVFL
jgi:hypothetical protein